MNRYHQLIVIGPGSGGRDTAILGARTGLRVLLVEKDDLGGTWFHRGCYPIRTLRACATHYQEVEKSSRFGLSIDLSETGWADRIATQRRVSKRLAEDLGRSLEELSVQIRFGTAKLVTPNEVEIFHPNRVGDRVSGQNIIIAPGSRPAFSSAENSKILTSEGKLASELGRSRW
ncbi:MAG TPA: FAD-dependent oxidoreductase [Chthoniobacterales bacterium]|jgi:dihydrolipoamide dehydrogenase|nr:FAD-dependent oxidoreductase [Chthoniobacterales bacterium]